MPRLKRIKIHDSIIEYEEVPPGSIDPPSTRRILDRDIEGCNEVPEKGQKGSEGHEREWKEQASNRAQDEAPGREGEAKGSVQELCGCGEIEGIEAISSQIEDQEAQSD